MDIKRILVVSLLIIAAAAFFRFTSTLNRPPAATGALAPDFRLKTLAGDREVSLSQFRGKPVLVVFWASWCGPCRQEMPTLRALHQEFDQSLEIISVATASDDINNSRAAAASDRMVWAVVHDTDRAAQSAYGFSGIPFLALIDKQGRFLKTWSGTTAEAELREAIKSAL